MIRPASKRCIVMLIVVTMGTACAAPPAATTSTVDVYKSLGRKQCEAGGETLDALQARLKRGGVIATAASCGTDGMMRIAMCGAGTGDIGIFTVRKADAARAAKLGFRPLTDLREAERTPCPGTPDKDSKK